MWKATFVNQYGTTFTANDAEAGIIEMGMLEYIQYCTERNSILVSLEKVEPDDDEIMPCGCVEGMHYCEPAEPEDDGYYYSGTGEWSEDSSYEDYLNR